MDYIQVDKAPENLKDNEMVIEKPTFIEQIAASKLRRGVSKLTTVNALRDALMLITDKYDNTVNPYRLSLNKYEGLTYETNDDLSKIILKILDDAGIDLVTKAIDFHLKNRDLKVNTVYFVSDDLAGSTAFIANGFNLKNTPKKTTKKEESLV